MSKLATSAPFNLRKESFVTFFIKNYLRGGDKSEECEKCILQENLLFLVKIITAKSPSITLKSFLWWKNGHGDIAIKGLLGDVFCSKKKSSQKIILFAVQTILSKNTKHFTVTRLIAKEFLFHRIINVFARIYKPYTHFMIKFFVAKCYFWWQKFLLGKNNF